MRIAIIGGVERMEADIRRACQRLGVDVEFHPGHVSGPQHERLASMIGRADLTIVGTDVNSHTMVNSARVVAAEQGRRLALVRRTSVSAIRREIEWCRGGEVQP